MISIGFNPVSIADDISTVSVRGTTTEVLTHSIFDRHVIAPLVYSNDRLSVRSATEQRIKMIAQAT